MFSGIVEERGEVTRLDGHRLVVSCRTVHGDSPVGASVAVSGVCLTVVDRREGSLSFDLSEETLARSGLHRVRAGDHVNLERPVTLASRLGGHLVQGHVDGLGRVQDVVEEPSGGVRVRIWVPEGLRRYLVQKGSVTVDGVSLTVAELHDDGITIALIPHTLAVTTFGTLRPDAPVNLEVDVIAKYVERLTGRPIR